MVQEVLVSLQHQEDPPDQEFLEHPYHPEVQMVQEVPFLLLGQASQVIQADLFPLGILANLKVQEGQAYPVDLVAQMVPPFQILLVFQNHQVYQEGLEGQALPVDQVHQ